MPRADRPPLRLWVKPSAIDLLQAAGLRNWHQSTAGFTEGFDTRDLKDAKTLLDQVTKRVVGISTNLARMAASLTTQ
jgi:hypothetical protein